MLSKDKHGFTEGQQESFLMSDIENFVADIVYSEKVRHARIFIFRSSRLEDRARRGFYPSRRIVHVSRCDARALLGKV